MTPLALWLLACSGRCERACRTVGDCGWDEELCADACHADDEAREDVAACLKDATCADLEQRMCAGTLTGCGLHFLVIESPCLPAPVQLVLEDDCYMPELWEQDWGRLGAPVVTGGDGLGWTFSWYDCSFPSADTTLPCAIPPLGETCEVSLYEVF